MTTWSLELVQVYMHVDGQLKLASLTLDLLSSKTESHSLLPRAV